MRFAPDGYHWLCTACGKTATKDRYNGGRGWDESCMLNSLLVPDAAAIDALGSYVVRRKWVRRPPPDPSAPSAGLHNLLNNMTQSDPAEAICLTAEEAEKVRALFAVDEPTAEFYVGHEP